MTRRLLALLLLGGLLSTTGCIGSIRDTTTARTATEILLVSTAAERAVKRYDASALNGKAVFIDDKRFESVDKAYVLSALRDHLAGSGVTLVEKGDPITKENQAGADFVLEIRNATLGIWDGDFVLGIPQLPVSAQGFPPVLLPPLYAFRRLSSQGFAKLQFWLYDPATKKFIGRSKDLWGHSFYNQWWWFGVGPFDGSNDIYPEFHILESAGVNDAGDPAGEKEEKK
ncbi:MAG: DUF6655 family protein [Planctomycetota bacterium]